MLCKGGKLSEEFAFYAVLRTNCLIIGEAKMNLGVM